MNKPEKVPAIVYYIGAVMGVALYVLGALIFVQSLSNDNASLPFALFVIVVLLMVATLFSSAVGLLMRRDNLFVAFIAAVLQIFVGGAVLMNILRSDYMPDDNIKLVYYYLAAFAPIVFGTALLLCTVTVQAMKVMKPLLKKQ